jgi:hypothetical protein
MEANIFGREVEDKSVVLLIDQKATLALGQQLTIDGDGDSVPPGQDIDAVVGTLDVSRLFHSVLLQGVDV